MSQFFNPSFHIAGKKPQTTYKESVTVFNTALSMDTEAQISYKFDCHKILLLF